MGVESLQPLLETMTALLGRLAFPEEKLRDIVMWKKRSPERYIEAYNLCDGEHGLTQIADAIRIDKAAVSRILSDWKELGIIYEVSKSGGRFYKKLYKLEPPKETDTSPKEEAKKESEAVVTASNQAVEPVNVGCGATQPD
jgi:predicted transcriptional regulator